MTWSLSISCLSVGLVLCTAVPSRSSPRHSGLTSFSRRGERQLLFLSCSGRNDKVGSHWILGLCPTLSFPCGQKSGQCRLARSGPRARPNRRNTEVSLMSVWGMAAGRARTMGVLFSHGQGCDSSEGRGALCRARLLPCDGDDGHVEHDGGREAQQLLRRLWQILPCPLTMLHCGSETVSPPGIA